MMVANMAAVKPVYPGIKPFIPNPDLMKAKLTARSKVTFKESNRSPSNTPATGKPTSSNQQLS